MILRPTQLLSTRLKLPSRRLHLTAGQSNHLHVLADGSLERFRTEAFIPSKPTLLPRGHFASLPGIQKWFLPSQNAEGMTLNHTYLQSFGSTIVPLELTSLSTSSATGEKFERAEAPLSIFLDWTKLATSSTSVRLYLAQAPMSVLPGEMRADLPTPEHVLKAGQGDIYDINLWMGIPPTYTPLHRDPNPNLFVQLAGSKIVRLMAPDVGDDVFATVQGRLSRGGSSVFRGEEMMRGEEKDILERVVWGETGRLMSGGDSGQSYEINLESGDGLFIPRGWWHSIKGVGEGVTGSVNWWFR